MLDRSDAWLLLPRPVRRFPADLGLVIALVSLAFGAVLVGDSIWSPLRLVFGFPLLFFLPGYALVAALFPESVSETSGTDQSHSREGWFSSPKRGVGGVERFTLSIAVSLAVVPLIGYILSFSPWGLDLLPGLVSVSIFTIGCALVAAIRRWSLPESERFFVPFAEAYAVAKSKASKDTVLGRPLTLVLIISVLVASAGLVYTTTVPRSDEQFTEFYLVTKNESGGLIADDYPRNFTKGEPKSVHVGIENREYERMNYTVVVLLQRRSGENNSSVTAQRTLERYRVTTEHGQTVVENRSIEPSLSGNRLQLTFLLYRGAPPPSPSTENAYRRVHLRISVKG